MESVDGQPVAAAAVVGGVDAAAVGGVVAAAVGGVDAAAADY